MSKILSKEEWLKRKYLKRITRVLLTALGFLILLIFMIWISVKVLSDRFGRNNPGNETITQTLSNGEVIKIDYLIPNEYSRPRTKLKRINGIVIHYTANPGTSAENNRSYFEGLRNTKTTYASSHFIIGLEGEILQCLPLTEISYASNDRNGDTISIECCHEDESGVFNEKTYASLVSLTAALCTQYNIKEEDIIRHYDVTGKPCPLYYVEHEADWETFKADVIEEISKYLPEDRRDSSD